MSDLPLSGNTPLALPPDEGGTLWRGRQSLAFPWFCALITALIFVPASFVLVPVSLDRLLSGRLSGASAGSLTGSAFLLFGVLASLFSLLLLVIIPLGGLSAEYRLTKAGLTIESRLLGRRRRWVLPLEGLRLHHYGWGRVLARGPADGRLGGKVIFLYSRKDRRALRDALPKGAFFL